MLRFDVVLACWPGKSGARHVLPRQRRLFSAALETVTPRPVVVEVSGKRRGWIERAVHQVVLVARFGYLCVLWFPVMVVAPWAYYFESVRGVFFRLLRRTVTLSGPLAMKCAQWCSTRADIFPPLLIRELSTFQASSPDHPFHATKQIMQKSLDMEDLSLCFDQLEHEPVGSGTIGQVHKGKFLGVPCAVKVVHPHTRTIVERDIAILDFVTRLLEKMIPSLYYLDFSGATREFGESMHRSVDLTFEAQNLRAFERMFRGDKEVRFPKVFLESPDVLVMSFEPGEPLRHLMDSPGQEARKKKVASVGMRLFADMIFANFIHGDLHPGNILVRGDCVTVLDCGLVVTLSERNRRNFYSLLGSMVMGDARKSAALMLHNSIGSGKVDEEQYVEDMDRIFKKYVTRTFKTSHLGTALREVLKVSRKHQVRLESAFANLITTCVVLEGVGKSLDPDLSLFWFFKDLLKEQVVGGGPQSPEEKKE